MGLDSSEFTKQHFYECFVTVKPVSDMCMDIDFSFLVSFSFFSGETRMSVFTYPGM